MNKHNINVGDTVKVIANKSHHRLIIGEDYKINDIKCSNSEHGKCIYIISSWFLTIDEIEPATHTFDGWAVFNENGEIVQYSRATSKFMSKSSVKWGSSRKTGYTCKPVSVTVKIKQDGKED